MGHYSWLDCKNGSQILMNAETPVYVLVPKQFQKEYGDKDAPHHIAEERYDGYGHFGGRDIYELAADWNREALRRKLPDYRQPDSETMYKVALLMIERMIIGNEPKVENFPGLYDFEKEELAKQGYTPEQIEGMSFDKQTEDYWKATEDIAKRSVRIHDFLSGSKCDGILRHKYGDDYKREIGIDISCGDERNLKLPFPIEITHDAEAEFDEMTPSSMDEYQGVYHNRELDIIEDVLGQMYDCSKYIVNENDVSIQFNADDTDVWLELDHYGTAKGFADTVFAYSEGLELDLGKEVDDKIKASLKELYGKLSEVIENTKEQPAAEEHAEEYEL